MTLGDGLYAHLSSVLSVGDRASAEKALGRERFDLVISEVDLGAEDGFGLAPIVRASNG